MTASIRASTHSSPGQGSRTTSADGNPTAFRRLSLLLAIACPTARWVARALSTVRAGLTPKPNRDYDRAGNRHRALAVIVDVLKRFASSERNSVEAVASCSHSLYVETS